MKLLGICREGNNDQFVWTGKMKAGNIMVADTYNTLCGREVQPRVICDFYVLEN